MLPSFLHCLLKEDPPPVTSCSIVMVVNIGRIPPWPRRRGSAARPRRSAAAAGLIALLAASVPPLAAAASSSSTGVLSAWAATRNAANLPIPASRLDLLAQDEEGEEMMGDDATPKVSIYSSACEACSVLSRSKRSLSQLLHVLPPAGGGGLARNRSEGGNEGS